MKTKAVLELDDLKRMAAAVEAEAARNGWAVSIAVVDDGGHPMWLQRLDNASSMSSHLALGKAQTAAISRMESKGLEEFINRGHPSFLSARMMSCVLEGGVPILKDGQCLGGVGVSGVMPNEDAHLARLGVAALDPVTW